MWPKAAGRQAGSMLVRACNVGERGVDSSLAEYRSAGVARNATWRSWSVIWCMHEVRADSRPAQESSRLTVSRCINVGEQGNDSRLEESMRRRKCGQKYGLEHNVTQTENPKEFSKKIFYDLESGRVSSDTASIRGWSRTGKQQAGRQHARTSVQFWWL
jgi:hypothetical protein